MVLAGDLDMASGHQLRQIGAELIAGDGCTRFLIDLIDVPFIDCAGLGALVAMRNAAAEQHLPLALLDPSAQVRKALALAQLADAFSIEHSSSG